MRISGWCVALVLASSAARADVLYSYNYDLTDTFAGVTGSFSFSSPTFVTASTFVPAIYHNDPAGVPFQFVEFRNPFQKVDGSPLVSNPVVDLHLAGGFEIDSFAGGPLNLVGSYTAFDFGPHNRATMAVALVPDGVLYSYGYDLTDTFAGVVGDFSFTAPTFLTSSTRFDDISHVDPSGKPMEFVELRNPFAPVDGSPLVSNPVVDLHLGGGFEIDSFAGGPLDEVGTYTAFDFGPHNRATLTVSGSPARIPEPGSEVLLIGLAMLYLAHVRRPRRAPAA